MDRMQASEACHRGSNPLESTNIREPFKGLSYICAFFREDSNGGGVGRGEESPLPCRRIDRMVVRNRGFLKRSFEYYEKRAVRFPPRAQKTFISLLRQANTRSEYPLRFDVHLRLYSPRLATRYESFYIALFKKACFVLYCV